jgi:type VI secretion system protein ImpF
MNSASLNNDIVLPCLLDRLTDRYPKAKTEGIQQKVVSIKEYKNSILRDLSFLLNSNSHISNNEFENHTYAKESVLNYGIIPLSGSSVTDDKKKDLEESIKNSIIKFEQRISAESLNVKIIDSKDEKNSTTEVALIISGELLPLNTYEKMHIKTIVDLETGACKLRSI